MTDTGQQIDLEDLTKQSEAQTPERKGPKSGYARIRIRFHKLVDEYEVLKADYASALAELAELKGVRAENQELQEALGAMQANTNRLLEQHQRLMQGVRSQPVRYGEPLPGHPTIGPLFGRTCSACRST